MKLTPNYNGKASMTKEQSPGLESIEPTKQVKVIRPKQLGKKIFIANTN
jgi:hypothetical protein